MKLVAPDLIEILLPIVGLPNPLGPAKLTQGDAEHLPLSLGKDLRFRIPQFPFPIHEDDFREGITSSTANATLQNFRVCQVP